MKTKENYFQLFIEGVKQDHPDVEYGDCVHCGDPVFYTKLGGEANYSEPYWQHLKWNDEYESSYLITRCIPELNWGVKGQTLAELA